MSLVVSVVTALLDIVADDLVDKTNLPLVFATGLSATGAATFGDVFLSGFLCRIVATTSTAPGPRSGPLSGRWLRICHGAA